MKYFFKLFAGLAVTFGVMLLIMWMGYGVSKLFSALFTPAECTIIILLTVLCSIGGTMLLGREGVTK